MNKKNIYKQIDQLMNKVRFSNRLVLGMGSLNNVAVVDNYLQCYSLKIAAIIDNDDRKEGLLYQDCKVFLPESILKPFNEKALIIIISPGYWKDMKVQLEGLGYKEMEHFFILHDENQNGVTWGRFYEEISNLSKGYNLYKDILKKYGKDTQIVLLRGATGDVYINGLFLNEYMKKKNFHHYVLTGDAKGLNKISKLFDMDHIAEPLSFAEAEQLQKVKMVLNPDNLLDVFPWQYTLYVNRCRIRMTERFNFMDTYVHHVYEGKVSKDQWKMPRFKAIDNDAEKRYLELGIERGNTVIIAPFAYSVHNLPICFWNQISKELVNRGYKVYANISPTDEINPFENMKSLFFSFQESVPLLEYAGYFLGIRSGLCDIISSAKCKKIILYPTAPQKLNYSVHRSDLSFSGLEIMGLSNHNIVEIESDAIKDITNEEANSYDIKTLYYKYDELATMVLKEFTK